MSIPAQSRVLITGAGSGLGLALVHQLVERGGRVLATDVHSETPEPLRGLAQVTYRKLDVTQDVDWATARDWVTEEWDGLDYLFNNAGVAAGGRIELTEMDQWQWIVDINLLGVARGCRTFTPMLKAQRSGHIVNTASAAGLIHPPRMSEYNAVKAGVVALSETLLHELKPFGVQVSVVCPTFFKTNLTESLRGKDEAARQSAAKLDRPVDRDRRPDRSCRDPRRREEPAHHLDRPQRASRLRRQTVRTSAVLPDDGQGLDADEQEGLT
ncbi:SDR family NAD(P)-dependent oxidoreductase [Aeromicrobium sp. UC242_57]|uniref:SDR family NAD(P)-dependent oxidoreductase n=1 Tax=Aeromicrobium sp. UC242_57 TaxID=3374624 RepID=UPI0037B199AF